MKYSKSNDGMLRCSVKLEIRLTKNEYAEIASIVKRTKHKSVTSFLETILIDHERLYALLSEEEACIRYTEESKNNDII